MPALVTVKVEPRSSSGLSVPARAASARRATSAPSSSSERVSQSRTTGTTRPCVGLDGDAEVVAVEVDDLVALEPRVQLRELLQRLRAGLEHRRDEQLEVDVREVALLDPGHGRHLAVRARHVLGDQAAHAAQRLPPSLRTGPGACPPDVAAPRTSSSVTRPCGPVPCERVEVDAELLRERRTSGVARTLPVGDAVLGPGPWTGPVRAGGCAGAAPSRRRSRRAPCRPGRPSPSSTRICATCPAAGDGISTVVLSVWISTSGSSSAISSPTGDEPAGDLALGQPLAEVGQLELVGHGGGI